MKWGVPTMGFRIDIDGTVSRQKFDHVQIAMFGSPMKRSVSIYKVLGLGQPWIIPEHFAQGDVVALGGLDHPLLGGLVQGADGG
jgi:hypothetical protein